ncbi:MAG TPA: SMP-30/gluconolactonase/LRE family protein [Streptosporangiaceae bacterium]|nr:SMP-30/gluconolactonase/LRE family protein [Streptosporangiaceae bacterium]
MLTARLFAKVAGPDPGPFGTNLEGASFDRQGGFYFVNTTAPPGQPKIMTLNLATRKVTSLYTDASSQLNCLVFGPSGTMFLCDLKAGRVARFNPSSQSLSTVLDRVGGSPLVPDDLAIDQAGDMYIADYRGTPAAPTGRIVLRQANGTASVVVTGLAHPNGVVFTPNEHALWVTEDLPAKLDQVADQLSSPAATAPAPTVHTAAYLSLGADAYADSLTTDGQGNVYMAVYGGHEVLMFSPAGIQIGRVELPASASRVTHVAIKPGTRDAFVTASGPGGGYIYTFTALAPAPAGSSNGG